MYKNDNMAISFIQTEADLNLDNTIFYTTYDF